MGGVALIHTFMRFLIFILFWCTFICIRGRVCDRCLSFLTWCAVVVGHVAQDRSCLGPCLVADVFTRRLSTLKGGSSLSGGTGGGGVGTLEDVLGLLSVALCLLCVGNMNMGGGGKGERKESANRELLLLKQLTSTRKRPYRPYDNPYIFSRPLQATRPPAILS